MYKKIKKTIINNYKWILCFICLVLFLALAEDVFNHEIMKGDIIGYKFISAYLINDSLTPIIKIITWSGSATCLLPLTLILLIAIKDKKTGLQIGANLIIITILNQMLKFILQRPRPIEFKIINETGYSFPSGHSMVSVAFYGFILYLVIKNVKNKYFKYIASLIIILLMVLIPISRVYLGVHYPSDVIGGALFSLGYLLLFVMLYNKFCKE